MESPPPSAPPADDRATPRPGDARGPRRPDAAARADAQRRADRIKAFQEELDTLEREGVALLTPEQRARVAQHHAERLAAFQQAFDIDPDATTQKMSRGMQAASFFGAVAFSAAVFSFFYRFWGELSTTVQVSVVTVATVIAVIAIEVADRRERTGYIASLIALVAFACFMLQLVVYGQVFNIRPSPGAYLAWGAFGVTLGYAYGFRLPFAIGLASVGLFVTALIGILAGGYWRDAMSHAEIVALASLIVLFGFGAAHARVGGPRIRVTLDPVVRLVGLLILFGALFVLTWGAQSFLFPASAKTAEIVYQVLFVPVAIAAIAVGLRRRWNETYFVAATFLTLFLLSRFSDWWWDWMPKYLFFLILGLFALGLLFALRRVRRRLLEGSRA